MENITDTMAGAAAAVTGPNTPTNVMASRPTKESVYSLYGGMVLSGLLAILIIGVIAGWWTPKPWIDAVSGARIMWLGIALVMAVICAPITVIALASSRLGRVEASAGENHLTLSGRDSA